MKYRPEIDGLRALAVGPVILFHAGLGPFPGGFVGVDVFFVLSGYLITTILAAEIGTGRFSLLRFYERRARRILPALVLVMLCCIPFAWAWMTPAQYDRFGRSLVSVVLFVSNIQFWREFDYFAPVSELKPLLHTWSLAVEEQFYLLFPPLLALLWRGGRRVLIGSLAALALASLALAQWGSQAHPTAAFYLAVTRGWELLAGALAGLWLLWRGPLPSGAGGLAGLALILGAAVFFDAGLPFPGLPALVPVAGAVLVILCATGQTPAARLLGLRPLVGIGLISYSAYLWHQPLFAFARLASLTAPSDALLWALTGLTLVLAWASWHLVEQPFRTGRVALFATRGRVFAASAGAALLLAGIGGGILATGRPALERAHPGLFAHAGPPPLPGQDCPGFAAVGVPGATCLRRGTGTATLVVWGDSHAAALGGTAAAPPGHTVYFVSHYGCPPGAGFVQRHGTRAACAAPGEVDRVLGYVADLAPETVVLVARWTLYLHGWHSAGRLQAQSHFLSESAPHPGLPRPGLPRPGLPLSATADASAQALERGVARAVDRLQARGARVLLVSQPFDLNRLGPRGLLLIPAVPRATGDAWHAAETGFLATLAARFGVGIVDSKPLTCTQALCRIWAEDGTPLYVDDNHLSATGLHAQWEAILGALAGTAS